LTALIELVAVYGPGVLFAMAVLETSFVTGLIVPSGMAAAFATVLSAQGGPSLGVVALAAGAGGILGDLTGYAIGRIWGDRLRGGRGWVARTLARHDRTLGRFMGRHPLYSVTGARLVAFVRTLMPLSSGMARLPAARFIAFDVPGVLLWLALYMGIGWLAGESWRRVSSLIGAGWTVLFVVAGLLLWRRARRRGELRGAGTGETDGAGGTSGVAAPLEPGAERGSAPADAGGAPC
jgi:membrane protein DedA with SNARE-associated domain